MRFFENGPDIPDQLINERNSGSVVFFCGAGVSMPALPSFHGLAERVLTELRVDLARLETSRSLDHLFGELYKDFGAEAVETLLYKLLRPKRPVSLRQHQIILDLSRDGEGRPQLVSTNFDTLFERVDRSLHVFEPPALPALAHGQAIGGLVYLHGRLAKPNPRIQARYVISRASFGRAYLAEGWAAQFVRELRDRYTVVLVGYRAEDPPVEYLLEGLNARGGTGRPPLYAFVDGEPDAAWFDRGVTPICYDRVCEAHSGLWDSLEAWAAASRDPAAWNASLVALGQREPSQLSAFERGKVVHLISSAPGSGLFASANPIPPADWLCVFDTRVRYAEPGYATWDRTLDKVDPHEMYRLDSDPPRQAAEANETTSIPAEDFLRWRTSDPSYPERQHLAHWHALGASLLPPRLSSLASWLVKVMDQPAAIWWAARAGRLHPEVLRKVRLRLSHEAATLPAPVKTFWRSYLEWAALHDDDEFGLRWYEIAERLKSDGWTSSTMRAMENAVQPQFFIGKAVLPTSIPPSEGWDKLHLGSFAEIEVGLDFSDDETVAIPDAKLPWIVDACRRALLRYTEMVEEVSATHYWRPPTLIPTGEPGETFHGSDVPILRFRDLFIRLKAHSPELTLQQLEMFPVNNALFAKFVMFAAVDTDFMPAAVALRRLIEIPTDLFWRQENWRELLHALRARWPQWSPRQRSRIERRLLKGPPRWSRERPVDHRERKASTTFMLLRHLELHGVTLSDPTRAKLAVLRRIVPSPRDDWAMNADGSIGSRGGFIEEVKDPMGTEYVPLGEVVAAATALGGEDLATLQQFKPFAGLVQTRPARALAALRLMDRQGEHPDQFWKQLLSDWPTGAPRRATSLLAFTLGRLPVDVLWQLRFYVPSWLRTHLPGLADSDLDRSLSAFDAVVARYVQADMPPLGSSLGEVSVGGVVQKRSAVSLEKAINAPGGTFAMVLTEMLPQAVEPNALPSWFTARIDTLLAMEYPAAGHAMCVLAQRAGWFDHWAPDWTALRLLPALDVASPLSEAAWHGLLASRGGLSHGSWLRLKRPLLAVAGAKTQWRADPQQQRSLYQLVVDLSDPVHGRPILSVRDIRAVLQDGDAMTRSLVVQALAERLRRGGSWARHIRPIIEKGWPKALALQTEETARAFAQVAEAARDDYADAVRVVRPYLRPVGRLDMLAYRLKRDSAGPSLIQRFPDAALNLLDALIGDEPQSVPWGLRELVEAVGNASPRLRQTDAWLRLRKLAG